MMLELVEALARFDRLSPHASVGYVPVTTIEAVTTASPQSEPEVLTVGPGEAGRLSRRRRSLVAVVLGLLGGLVVWRFWPARAPLFSLSDLQGVCAWFARRDE